MYPQLFLLWKAQICKDGPQFSKSNKNLRKIETGKNKLSWIMELNVLENGEKTWEIWMSKID